MFQTVGIVDVQIIKICFSTWRSLHGKGQKKMMAAMWYHFILREGKSKTFIGHLPHCKQGTVCLCVLLSDLSPWQNLVRFFFVVFFFFLIIGKENRLRIVK